MFYCNAPKKLDIFGGIGLELIYVYAIEFIDSLFYTAVSDEKCIEDFKIHLICTELIIGAANKSVIAKFQTSFKIQLLLRWIRSKSFFIILQLNKFRLDTYKRHKTMC